MGNKISLVEMRISEKGKVIEIQGGYGMIRKLETLGIREGKEIKKLSAQLMRGPVIIQVSNTRVAIGFGMARRIIVEVSGNT
ncbi:MAG: FeoA family protein [bacterium]|nr:FeoA family protein [bacterium]